RTVRFGDRHPLGAPVFDDLQAEAALPDTGWPDDPDHLAVTRNGPTERRFQPRDLVATADEAREAMRPRRLNASADGPRLPEREGAHGGAHALDADPADLSQLEEARHQRGRVPRQEDFAGLGDLLRARRQPDRMALRRVVHAQIVADLADDDLAGVEPH